MKKIIPILGAVLFALSLSAVAEDTEVYFSIATPSPGPTTARKKVMIILDTKSSMKAVQQPRDRYDPRVTYANTNPRWNFRDDRVYWAWPHYFSSREWSPIESEIIDQYFPLDSYRCGQNRSTDGSLYLMGYIDFFAPPRGRGIYGQMRVWREIDGVWAWNPLDLSTGTYNAQYVECRHDFIDENPGNPGLPAIADGYPTNGTAGPYGTTPDRFVFDGYSLTGDYRIALVRNRDTDTSGDDRRYLYSANWLRWYHADVPGKLGNRMEIVKYSIRQILKKNLAVDFGVLATNRLWTDGGRVIQKISNLTMAQRVNLADAIDSGYEAGSWSMTRSLYESYLYFAGQPVTFGLKNAPFVNYWGEVLFKKPTRDLSAEVGGRYISPILSDGVPGQCNEVSTVIVTDGWRAYTPPVLNPRSPSRVASTTLTGLPAPGPSSIDEYRLGDLAEWMYSNDLDGDSSNGVQRAVTSVVAMGTLPPGETRSSKIAEYNMWMDYLKDVGLRGGGGFYSIVDTPGALDLELAIQKALDAIQIGSEMLTYSAPSVAVNTFNRTENLDDVYIGMFKPSRGSRWTGNLKKFTLNSSGVLVDALGVLATNPSTGGILATAQSLWSTSADGGEIEQGGAGALLAARAPSTRVIKTNTGMRGTLEDFVTTNRNLSYGDFGAASNREKNELINWARGVDVDDEDGDSDNTDTRPWIIGDPLHSQPLVINYGARTGYSTSNPDVRIVMGTNHGVLHMFSGDDGGEDWAFMPTELLPLTKAMRDNSGGHQAGIDGSATAYVYDKDNDGTISGVDDKVYIFFGLRRGGSAYYALDVTNPDNPEFMWRLDNSSVGFAELGQSWSTPVVTRIPGYTGPVMIIGGGYDTNKDATSIGTDDGRGRGIFIVDAVTGALVWSVTPGGNSSTNLQATGLVDSIPASISVMDSNGDQLTDRLYVGDTGGHVWRIDMPGNALPGASQNTWSIFKLAALGGATIVDDRRFFNKIDIVSTRDGALAFDGILLGSGNRSNPNETNVSNQFYMIRDLGIVTKYHDSSNTPALITQSVLYNAGPNALQTSDAELSDLRGRPGWRIPLGLSGEKNLAPSVTLDGTVYFTTFAPPGGAGTVGSCGSSGGTGQLYGVNVQRATAVRKWDGTVTDASTVFTTADRQVDMGNRLPSFVTPHFRQGGTRILGVGAGENNSGTNQAGKGLVTTGTYWYKAEG